MQLLKPCHRSTSPSFRRAWDNIKWGSPKPLAGPAVKKSRSVVNMENNPYQGMDNQEIVEPGGPQGPGNQEITPKKV